MTTIPYAGFTRLPGLLLTCAALSLLSTHAAADATSLVASTLDSGRHSSLQLDAGRPVVAYREFDGANSKVKLATCTAGCATDSPTWVIADVAASGWYPSLQLNAGKPVVTYTEQNGGTFTLILATCTAGCATASPTWVKTNVDAGATTYSHALQLIAGNPVIAYEDRVTTEVRLATCTAGCDTPAPTWVRAVVSGQPKPIYYATVSLQLNEGKPVVGYEAFIGGGLLYVATCTAGCATASPTWAIKQLDGALEGHSLALRDGKPAFAFYQLPFLDQNLKFSACIGDCETAVPNWVTSSIDTAGNVGVGPSLLFVDGLPVVSYYDLTNKKVKIATCTANCFSAAPTWSLKTVADGGDTNTLTSMQVSGGTTLVTYFDHVNQDLRLASIGDGPPVLGLSPTQVDFVYQSQGTTSLPRTVTVTNSGATPLTITSIASSDPQFGVSHDCPAALQPLANCAIRVTFTPAIEAAELNATRAITGLITVATNLPDSPRLLGLVGVMEKSLVTHYYQAILGRDPESIGRAFWSFESGRVRGLGAHVNEVWFSMAQAFFASPEYIALDRDNAGFVTDLYRTFFNRDPDGGGLAYWVEQRVNGLPREILLATFMFSPEFRGFTQTVFPNVAVRAEIDAVMDFYRGLLSRLPDDDGFRFWLSRFHAAQCAGPAAILAEVEAMSRAFAESGEYAARGRNNAQYVGDLYNAFLRRGGDLSGVQFWVDQIATGSRSRDQVRLEFKNSPEFQARVQAVIAQGCL